MNNNINFKKLKLFTNHKAVSSNFLLLDLYNRNILTNLFYEYFFQKSSVFIDIENKDYIFHKKKILKVKSFIKSFLKNLNYLLYLKNYYIINNIIKKKNFTFFQTFLKYFNKQGGANYWVDLINPILYNLIIPNRLLSKRLGLYNKYYIKNCSVLKKEEKEKKKKELLKKVEKKEIKKIEVIEEKNKDLCLSIYDLYSYIYISKLYKYFLSTFFLFHLKTSITPNLEILKQQFFLKILKLKLKKKKDIIKLNIIGKIKKTSKIQSFSFLKKQNISIKNILNKIAKLNLNLKKKKKKKINEIRHYKRQI